MKKLESMNWDCKCNNVIGDWSTDEKYFKTWKIGHIIFIYVSNILKLAQTLKIN